MTQLPFFDWSVDEYRQLAASVLRGERGSEGVAERLAEFSHLFGGHPVLPVNRGRTALRIALRAFHQERPERTEVIVPSYICPAVPESVLAVGLTPVPADVGSDLNLDPARLPGVISSSTLAVIAPHIYACPAKVPQIEAICRRSDVFMIDDAAPVMGIQIEGRGLGTFGDAGIHSFSQSKTVVAGDENAGGLLVVLNPRFEKKMRAAWAELPDPTEPIRDALGFLWDYRLRRYTRSPTYYWNRMRQRNADEAAGSKSQAKMSALTARIAAAQLRSLDRRLAQRREVVERYHELAVRTGMAAFPQYSPGRYLSRLFFSLPGGLSTSEVRARLREAGVDTRLAYPLWARAGHPESSAARAIAPRLIELPCHATTSEEVQLMWAKFSSVVREFTKPQPASPSSVARAAG